MSDRSQFDDAGRATRTDQPEVVLVPVEYYWPETENHILGTSTLAYASSCARGVVDTFPMGS